VFYKKDGTVDHVHDFNAGCGDQHIQWDDASQRWFFEVMECGPVIGFYVSTDASGKNWTKDLKITFPMDAGGDAHLDNVQLNVTTDKVLLLSKWAPPGQPQGDCIYPLDKASLIAGKATQLTLASNAGSCGLKDNDQMYALHYGYPEPSTAYFAAMADDQHLNW